MDTNEWILNNKKICMCKGITRKTIVDAIKKGAHTLDDVAIKTGCGTGACHGTRCDDPVEELLKEFPGE